MVGEWRKCLGSFAAGILATLIFQLAIKPLYSPVTPEIICPTPNILQQKPEAAEPCPEGHEAQRSDGGGVAAARDLGAPYVARGVLADLRDGGGC